MTTATATATDILPVTGKNLIMSEFSLKKYSEHATRDGVYYSADLYLKNKNIGHIENNGNGGGTWFYQNSREDLTTFEAWVAQNVEAGYIEAGSMGIEMMLDMVIDEFVNAKTVRLFAGKGYIVGFDNDMYGEDVLEIQKFKSNLPIPLPTTLADVHSQIIAVAKGRKNGRVWGTEGWIAVN